jgi:hypothetical protein
MVEITMLKLNIEDGSISANLPFSGSNSDDSDDVVTDGGESENSGGGKGRALIGVFLFLVIGAAIVRYLSGEEETEVEIETPDEPVGVTIDTDDDEN